MFSLSEIVCDFSVEAELKKKTEKKKLEEARYSSEWRTPSAAKKTKEYSLTIPLNHIPSRNAPKKTKENRVFYSPESYTSFQKCPASIY